MSRTCFNWLLGACLVLLSAGIAASAEDVTLENILAHQLKYFHSITSLDYTFQESMTPGKLGRKEAEMMDLTAPRANKSRIRSQNGMWRGDLDLNNTGRIESYAYDGDRYQMYRGASEYRMLDVQRGRNLTHVTYGIVPPTLRPFYFAYNNVEQDGYVALKDENLWKTAFQNHSARISSQSERVGDKDCVVVEFSWPDNRRACVYFAKGQGYFPIVVEVLQEPGAHLCVRTEVADLMKVSTDAGNVYLPTQVRLDSYNTDNGDLRASMVCEVDKHSIRINQQIEKADFTFPRANATHYTDRDNPAGK